MNLYHYKRIRQVLAIMLGVLVAGWLMLDAVSEGMHLYMTPSEVVTRPDSQVYMGGVVVRGSLAQHQSSYAFKVADDKVDIDVQYTGALPTMFKEGQDAVVVGYYDNQVFHAKQVMAKHDEYYRPKGKNGA